MNSAHTGITKIDFQFTGFTCGGNTANGEVTVSKPTTWPITMGRFILDAGGIMPFDDITVDGAFDGTGTHAYGTWNVASGGTTCTGTWLSVP